MKSDLQRRLYLIRQMTPLSRRSCPNAPVCQFLRATAGITKRVFATVRPSVRLSRPGTDSRYSGFLPYDSLESLVSKFRAAGWDRDSLRMRASKKGTLDLSPKNRYFTIISSSSVRTVTDRHRLAAYQNILFIQDHSRSSD